MTRTKTRTTKLDAFCSIVKGHYHEMLSERGVSVRYRVFTGDLDDGRGAVEHCTCEDFRFHERQSGQALSLQAPQARAAWGGTVVNAVWRTLSRLKNRLGYCAVSTCPQRWRIKGKVRGQRFDLCVQDAVVIVAAARMLVVAGYMREEVL